MGDPERYRQPEEIEKWQEDDPIGHFHNHLLKEKVATEKQLDAVQLQADEDMAEAVRFAEESPLPTQEDLYADVYVDAPVVKEA
jgi:pyruvate dehydrogenase E1 component alpha subunit